jgi:hypothetical protein
MLYDGMRFNMMVVNGGGASKHFFVNQADAQEVVLEVAGMSAEAETSGVHVNIVPKTGGNIFKGYFATTGNTGAMQQSNLNDELRARGLTNVSAVKRVYDVGGGFGGPFKRDTLWFYTAHRSWGSQEWAAGNFYNKTQGTPFYTPDPTRQGYTDYYNRHHTLRLTWQANTRHKFTGSHSMQRNCNCHLRVDDGGRSPEAATDYTYFGVSLSQASWSFPATNRLLFQAGGTFVRNMTAPRPQPEVEPTDVPIIELSRNYNYNASARGIGNAGTGERVDYGQHNERFSVSYISGSHAFKAGLFTLHGVQNFATWHHSAPSSPTPQPGQRHRPERESVLERRQRELRPRLQPAELRRPARFLMATFAGSPDPPPDHSSLAPVGGNIGSVSRRALTR